MSKVERGKLYAVPYNHGTLLYYDEECTRLKCNDPWHRHRTNKLACYDGYWWQLIVLDVKKDPEEEMKKFKERFRVYVKGKPISECHCKAGGVRQMKRLKSQGHNPVMLDRVEQTVTYYADE